MDKKIKVRLSYDFKTMKHYNYYNLVFKKKGYLIYLITAIISVGVTVYMAIVGQLPFAIVFGLLTLYFFYQVINFEKVIDNQITKFFLRNPRVFKKEVRITDETIEIGNEGEEEAQVTYEWQYIAEIHDTPDYFFLMAYKSQPVIISKDPEDFTEGNLEELTNLILDKSATKPYKKVDKTFVKRPITFVHPEIEENVEDVVEVEDQDVELKNVEEDIKSQVEGVAEQIDQEENKE